MSLIPMNEIRKIPAGDSEKRHVPCLEQAVGALD